LVIGNDAEGHRRNYLNRSMGRPGGNPWSYMTNQGINQIVINVGSNIKSISFRDTTDLDSATFGGNNPNDIGERKTVSIPPCGVLRFFDRKYFKRRKLSCIMFFAV
jgi:hypothetical protein